MDIDNFNIKDYLTTAQLAEKIGCHRSTVEAWCRNNIIPWVRIMKKYLIHKDTFKSIFIDNFDWIEQVNSRKQLRLLRKRGYFDRHGIPKSVPVKAKRKHRKLDK